MFRAHKRLSTIEDVCKHVHPLIEVLSRTGNQSLSNKLEQITCHTFFTTGGEAVQEISPVLEQILGGAKGFGWGGKRRVRAAIKALNRMWDNANRG